MKMIDLSNTEFDANSPLECVVHLCWYCLPADIMTEILSRPFDELVHDRDMVDVIHDHLFPAEQDLMDDIGATDSQQSAHTLLYHISELLKSFELPHGSTVIHGPVVGIENPCCHAVHGDTTYVIFE